jgi:hypothetical protein
VGFLGLPLSLKFDQTRSETIKKVLIWQKLVSSFHSMNKTAKWPSTLVVSSYQVQKCNQYLICIGSGRSLSHSFHWAKETDKLWKVVSNWTYNLEPFTNKTLLQWIFIWKVPNPH